MTHVDVQPDLLPLLGRVDNVLDGIAGFVEYYDFSLANSSYEARVHAISKIASICYANPKALNSISLFNRLQAESGGLPSSSYEFCPVLITKQQFADADLKHCWKFGEQIGDYLLTNLRALLEDVGEEASLTYFNTDPVEQQIIRDNFKVFLFNVNLACRAQMIRHRINWQELSRRYVSGKKMPFTFYEREKFQDMDFRREDYKLVSITEIYNQQCEYYNQALDQGARPEEARDLLPQAMMTQIWGAFQPNQLSSYFKLRLDKSAQSEIRDVATAMKGLIDGTTNLS